MVSNRHTLHQLTILAFLKRTSSVFVRTLQCLIDILSTMQFFIFVITLTVAAHSCIAQIFLNQPIAYNLAASHQPVDIVAPPHRAVEIYAAHESLLPDELVKSKKFYDNPRVASALAKSSWFGDKEMQVFEREAEKIPRDQIYKLAKNAGFVRRR